MSRVPGDLVHALPPNWIDAVLELLLSIAPGIDVRSLVERIDLHRCPAIELWLASYWQYARGTKSPRENDFVDLTIIAALPYAEVSLTERRLRHFVLSSGVPGYEGRVCADPIAAVHAIEHRLSRTED